MCPEIVDLERLSSISNVGIFILGSMLDPLIEVIPGGYDQWPSRDTEEELNESVDLHNMEIIEHELGLLDILLIGFNRYSFSNVCLIRNRMQFSRFLSFDIVNNNELDRVCEYRQYLLFSVYFAYSSIYLVIRQNL